MGIAQTLKENLQELLARVTEKGDTERADKIEDLLIKLKRHKTDFTFCGHFSAGKSSLINRLCGSHILPSSPIPTSANVVAIENGEEHVVIERADSEQLHITLAELDEACRNGVDFRRVYIQYPVPLLQHSARLLDTPGVDSTDDLHRKATEDALHMADAVFYVMDYNHVLSEMNFQYIRKLAEFGKPLYLIVNQIDKHRDTELSFDSFRKKVQDALDDWQVRPEGLYFVSVKKPDDPNNEWPYVEELLHKLVQSSESILINGLLQAVQQMIREHEAWLLQQEQDTRDQLARNASGAEEAGEVAPDDGSNPDDLQQAKEAHMALQAAWDQLGDPARRDLQKILDNANVIPAPSRDIAHQYLESRKSGFRVGLLFSERKTSAERDRRLGAWREEAAQQSDAHIRWHVTDYLKRLLDAWRLEGATAESAAAVLDRIRLRIDEEWLASLVQGGHYDDAYTLQYTRTVAEQIKQQYRKLTWDALDHLQELLQPVYTERAAELAGRLQDANVRYSAQRQLEELDLRLAEYIKRLRTPFEQLAAHGQISFREVYGDLPERLRHHRTEHVSSGDVPTETIQPEHKPGMNRQASNRSTADTGRGAQTKLLAAASKLRQACQLIGDMPMFNSFARTMRDKAERLESNQYTIALFGAFSAGKSSFANALLQSRVLPVSPNPTTAAINSVKPPTNTEPHGQAVLHYKSREAMNADVRLSLEKLHIATPDDEADLLRVIEQADLGKAAAGAKVHVAFLHAVRQGWSQFYPKLGSTETVDTETYRRAVADETQACFLESVELFVESAFAEQGMILVDTPGADSINARHTDVAFNYIKNADAILFVTYYNHAFSHADREFLLQLGRVKDTFALNKMFFIVNAADLASDEEELSQVVEHVRSNLASFGLHEPRIFPVSSLSAIDSLENGDVSGYEASGMEKFEADFYAFVRNELAEMSISSGEAELMRSREALAEWISALHEAQFDRESQSRKLSQGLEAAQSILRDPVSSRRIDDVQKEIQELIYYAAQRVSYRFGELYNLAFNPSTFADATMSDKDKLATAYGELLQYLAFDLSQELRATTLRVEAYTDRMLSAVYDEWSGQLHQVLQGFTAPERGRAEWKTPPCDVGLSEQPDEWKAVRSQYRNNRQFFEQDGKTALKNTLEALLQERIKRAALDSQQIFIEHYKGAFLSTAEALATQLQEEAAGYADAMLKALDSDAELPLYEQRLASLEELAKNV